MKVDKEKTEKILSEVGHLIRNKIFPKLGKASNWRTLEQDHAFKVKSAIGMLDRDLKKISRELLKPDKKGRKPAMTPDRKVRILLVKQLLGESNRKMMYMLVVFSTISGIFMGYKSIERLYSDKEVYQVLVRVRDVLHSEY